MDTGLREKPGCNSGGPLIQFYAMKFKPFGGGLKKDAGTAGRFKNMASFVEGVYGVEEPPGKIGYRRRGVKIIEDPPFMAGLNTAPA
jgi:hypothetical protein